MNVVSHCDLCVDVLILDIFFTIIFLMLIKCGACCFHQGQSTYSRQIKQVEDDIQQLLKKINELTGNTLETTILEVKVVVFPRCLDVMIGC